MRLVVADVVRDGPAVDARDLDVEAEAVVSAVRGESGCGAVSVNAPRPGPVHERIGYVRPGMGIAVKTALADAARSRGLSAPQDEQLTSVREELDRLSVPAVSTRTERRELGEYDGTTEQLRERVTELRGRLQAVRERGAAADADEVEAALLSAIRELSEAETEQVAARQRFERAQDEARAARDHRERRLRLQDRVANLERAARAHLRKQVETEYADAVAAVPGRTPASPFDADPVTAALAVGRVADLAAPVVLACDRFTSATAASSWLDTPVVWL